MLKISELFAQASNETRPASQDYWLNREFLLGNQWLMYNQLTGRPENMAISERIRNVTNRFATNHRTNMSKLLKERLAFQVHPNGADDASTHAAYVATEAVYGLYTHHNWERLRKRVSAATVLGGVAAISLNWDKAADDSIETPLTIAEFVVEPGSRDAETARWWIQAQTLPPGQVKEMYGLPEEPSPDASNGLSAMQRGMLARHLGGETSVPLTLVLTYYERPNGKNKGRVVTEVNGKTVEKVAWPFPFTDRLNLVVTIETEVPERWYGTTVYSQARAPQVALNVSTSNILEHLTEAAVARLLVPQSAVRSMKAFDDIPGNMYSYNDGSDKPSWLQPPQLHAWVRETRHDYSRDIDDIMGTHAVSRGDAPANLESGTAISILAEMDGSPAGHVLNEIGSAFGRMASLLLQMHEKFATGTRNGIIPSEDGPMATQWTGKDIHGQYNCTVPADALIPRSRAAQLQLATKMMEMGLISTPEEYVAFSEMPGGRNILDVTHPEIAHAKREHSKFATGETVVPEEWHNHPVHIPKHESFLSTPLFSRLSPANKEKVHLHIQAHRTYEAEALAQEVSRQEADPNMAALTGAAQLPVPPGLENPAEALQGPGPEAILPPDPDQQVEALLAEL